MLRIRKFRLILLVLSPMFLIWVITFYFKFDVSDEHFKMVYFKNRLETHKDFVSLCEFVEVSKFNGVVTKVKSIKGGARRVDLILSDSEIVLSLEGHYNSKKMNVNKGEMTFLLSEKQSELKMNLGDTLVKKSNSFLLKSSRSKVDILHWWREGFVDCNDAMKFNLRNELSSYLEMYNKARVKEKLNYNTQRYIESVLNEQIKYKE